MARSVKVDPLTRIEGHLAFRVEVSTNRVVDAFCSGEMFRGFEVILKGRHPMDAQQITQRICGVCPISHGIASVLAQDDAYQMTPPQNGRLLRNLIQAGNALMSHIVHFYMLTALDFIDIVAITKYEGNDPQLNHLKNWVKTQLASKSVYPAAPFLPRYEADYIEDTALNIVGLKHYLDALKIRSTCHKMTALFGGKVPHSPTLVPGGVTEKVTVDKIVAYKSMLKDIQTFIDHAYLPDVIAVAQAFPDYWEIARGCGNFLAYGVFPESENNSVKLFPAGVVMGGKLSGFEKTRITEDVMYSLFSSQSGLPPSRSQTIPDPHKAQAYSWIKAPRYNGQVMEVGPLARLMVAYLEGDTTVKNLINSTLYKAGKTLSHLLSVMGRHAARAIETKIIADRCVEWVEQLTPDEPTFSDFTIPDSASGIGLTEAPRGALGHWLEIKDGKIANYQCVVPTTWNCSPRDDRGNLGAIEQALIGTPVADEQNPIEAARVVRSFDPCIACAVH
jgi:ferredoxin hydrogenase large subunit/hydrogenase large subunit